MARAMQLGELQRKQRHAARSEQENRLARPHLRDLRDGVPCGERRAGQRRGLLERHVIGRRDRARLAQRDIFGEHAVDRAAERPRDRFRRNGSGRPVGKEGAADPVADLEPRDAGSDCDDLAGAVGQRNDVRLCAAAIGALRDHQVAIVERRRADPDQDLAMSRLRRRPVGIENDAFRTDRFPDFPGPHANPPRWSSCGDSIRNPSITPAGSWFRVYSPGCRIGASGRRTR